MTPPFSSKETNPSASPNDKRGDIITAAAADSKARFPEGLSIPESMRILSDTKGLSSMSTAISPGLNLPQLSPDTTERVFPIRSVVTLDSGSSSALQTPSLEISETKTFPFGEDTWTFPVATKSWSQPTKSTPEKILETLPSNCEPQGNLIRIGGRPKPFGTPTRMSKDGDQAATAPESPPSEHLQDTGKALYTEEVQKFGALLVFQESQGRLVVQAASRNTESIIGYTPKELFKLDCFCEVLRQDQKDDFLCHARSIRDENYNMELHGPDVLILFISTPYGTRGFWCTMHATKENNDYIICELESEEDSMSVFSFIGHKPDRSRDEVSKDELASDSKHNVPGSLRALRIFSERKREFDLTNILNAMSRVLQFSWNAQSLDVLFHSVIGVIKDLIGFYRVTVYQFDSDWNGVAVADAVDPDVSPDSYKNAKIPEYISSDELRRLHLLNKVCLLYSQSGPRAGLEYRTSEAPMRRVDMTHCYLLSTSPACSEVSAAMPTHTCMSIGIYVFGKLWGLISCQTVDQDMRLLPPIHKLCWLISNTLSSNIERLSYTLPFNIQERSSTAEVKVYKFDTAQAGGIISLFGADYGASSIFGETKILGKPSDAQEVLAVVEYLRMRNLNRILWSTEIIKDFPDLNYPPGFKSIFGLLYIPLSVDCRDFIIFFRAPQSTEAPNVADNPRAKWDPDGKVKRFRPLAWSAVDLGKAYILSVIYRTFTEVWQQKEAALQSTQFMRLLLANSAHEFRTPLNAIINYLEIALDGSLAQETRDNLSRSHSASKSLVYIINDLLDLTNAENGQSLIKDEVFDLSETLRDATDIFGEEAKQRHVDLHIVQHSQLPHVLGDQRRVRQIITNLISNAIQHTSSGAVTVESCTLPDTSEPDRIGVEVAIHDTGAGMSQETVEALFCELEQVSSKDYIRDNGKDGVGEKNVLGLGLALVARIVRNMDGQLSVKSEKDKGSCFKIRLKFPLPSGELGHSQEDSRLQNQHNVDAAAYPSEKVHDDPKDKEDNTSCGKDLFPTDHGPPFDIGISATTDKSHLRHFSNPESSTGPQSLTSMTPLDEQKPESAKQPQPNIATEATPEATHSTPAHKSNLHVLVAEDDPINSAILRKRLEKFGHTVHMTGNGRECASVYEENPSSFDAILMDIQVSFPVHVLTI